MATAYAENHDIGPLIGLDEVVLTHAPALVCDRCGHIMLEGEVVEEARRMVAQFIVRYCVELRPSEVRFLRETIGMTQAELADRLKIIRGTVTRWEAGDEALGPIQSFALRTLAAWALGETMLAREVGEPSSRLPDAPPPRPYQIGLIASQA